MASVACPQCGDHDFVKVIYLGLPGLFCEKCNCLWGMAAYAPAVTSDTDDGPMFAFMVYEGSYWIALWHWLMGGES